MTRDDVEAAVRRFHDVRKSNDAAQVRALFVDEPEFLLAGVPGETSVACSACGAEDFAAAAQQLNENWGWENVEFLDMVIEGATAAVRYRLTVRFTPLDRVFDTEVYDLMEFENGKIKRLLQYADTGFLSGVVAEALAS